MALGARPGTNAAQTVFADRRLHSTPFDGKAPFAHAHQLDPDGQTLNGVELPRVCPTPVPSKETLAATGCANAFEERRVHLRDHFGGTHVPTTRTLAAGAVRPAILQVFGSGDRKKSAKIRHCTAEVGNALEQSCAHRVGTCADRRKSLVGHAPPPGIPHKDFRVGFFRKRVNLVAQSVWPESRRPVSLGPARLRSVVRLALPPGIAVNPSVSTAPIAQMDRAGVS